MAFKLILKSFLMVWVCVAFSSQDANAILMNSWSLDPQYRAKGNESVGGVVVDYGDSAGYGSLVHLNPWCGLTAAHVVDAFTDASSVSASFGPSLFDSPGPTASISSWVTFPDWNGTRLSHDLAIVYYSEPLYDVPTATLATTAPEIGDMMICTGYGKPGVYGANGVYDGIRRGFDARVDVFGDSLHSVSDDYAGSIWRRPATGGLPLGGRGNPGDSGGGMFGYDDGLLYGIMVAGTGYSPNYMSYTYSLNLLEYDVYNWVVENTAHQTPVPEPSTLLLAGTGLAFILRKRR